MQPGQDIGQSIQKLGSDKERRDAEVMVAALEEEPGTPVFIEKIAPSEPVGDSRPGIVVTVGDPKKRCAITVFLSEQRLGLGL